MMKIAIGSDHGGFLLKEKIKQYLIEKGNDVFDVGTDSEESCAYSEFALKCAKKVANKETEYGILVCSSGEGIMIAANKVKGIRCGLVYNTEVARLIREHNNCNMMSLGAKFVSESDALNYVNIFLNTAFQEGRHLKRIEIITDYENKNN